jgi:predicted GNAT family acetyltransferase
MSMHTSPCATVHDQHLDAAPANHAKLEHDYGDDEDENAHDEHLDAPPAKHAKLEHDYGDGDDEDGEDGEDGLDEDEDDDPEEYLSPEQNPMMKLVHHLLTHGTIPPPLAASSGCKYRENLGGPLPSDGVVSGTLHLSDVPGSHLDYAVSWEVGVMLERELDDSDRGTPGYTRAARVMDIFETYVPPAERGKGHAKRLALVGFAVAHAYGYLVRPSCTYVSGTFLAANPMLTDWPTEKLVGCDELVVCAQGSPTPVLLPPIASSRLLPLICSLHSRGAA